MIPELIDVAGPWKVLPPGIHHASLEEMKNRYATNERRERLFAGFEQAFRNLTKAGCTAIYLNGSFVGENPHPGDFDCCWDMTGIDMDKSDPVLLDFSGARKAQKDKYGGEFFPSSYPAAAGEFFLSYFQKDKHTGKAKGIVRVH